MNKTEDTDGFSASDTALLSMYCVVFVIGVLANACLALAAMSGQQHSARNKSPSILLLGLCIADLLVCSLSAPLTVCFAVLAARPWPFAVTWCKLAFFLQAMPVAASTLSLVLVSIDRYVTVKYPRPVGKFQHKRNVETAGIVLVWLLSSVVTCPLLLIRWVPPRSGGRCVEVWNSIEWRNCFVLGRLFFIHIIPCIAVLVCHIGIRGKLTALSLTARAAHGELPLPVPLLRRPAHVIIVAGLANNTDAKVMTYQPDIDSSSDAGQIKLVDKVRNDNSKEPGKKRKRNATSNKKVRRPTKSEQEIREVNRKLRPQPKSSAGVARSVGSTLHSRRRLANALVSAAALFAGCWLPHIICTIFVELCALPSSQLKQMTQFSLLLGHAHSAINPVMYWALNHQSLQMQCLRVSLLAHLRLPAAYRNASSTNEAALGPFHPRYTRPNAPPVVRRQSSCYLY